MQKYEEMYLTENIDYQQITLSSLKQRFLRSCNLLEKVMAYSMPIPNDSSLGYSRKLLRIYSKLGKYYNKLELVSLTLLVQQSFLEKPEKRQIAALVNVVRELKFITGNGSKLVLIGEMLREFPSGAVASMPQIEQMYRLNYEMLSQALGAFTWEDSSAALEIIGWKNEIEALYQQIHRELVADLIGERQGQEPTLLALLAASNILAMAQNAANICAGTIFVETGVLPELKAGQHEYATDFAPGLVFPQFSRGVVN